MKTMSKIIVALFLIVSSPMVNAGPATEMNFIQEKDLAKVQTTWMQENLSLTPEQLNEVARINKEFAMSVKAIMADQEHEKTVRLEDLDEQIKEKDAELKKILDDEQFTKYAEQSKKWNENLRARVS